MTGRPSWKDIPIGSIILEPGNSVRYRTGDWAVFTPRYAEKTPPCNSVCPVGLDVQGFIARIVAGDYIAAWELIKERSPFPGVVGYVCSHPCEGVCNRGWYDEPIAVHELERFVAAYAHDHGPLVAQAPWRNENVAVVGAGPAGLSCAYQLARRGFPVTVFEALSSPGGVMRSAASEYRLLRPVLDREIADIERLGVRIVLNTVVGSDVAFDDLRRDYRAVFVATGAPAPRRLATASEDAEGLAATDFLARVNLGRDSWMMMEGVALASPNVFIGGDAVAPVAWIVGAIAAGRRAAAAIVATVDGESAEEPEAAPVAPFDLINPAYFPHQPQARWRVPPAEGRAPGRAEVKPGFTEAQARDEAERCFSCGVCNLCGNCWIFCPDIAVVMEDGERMTADLEYCKGCGICAKECPRGVIEMQSVTGA